MARMIEVKKHTAINADHVLSIVYDPDTETITIHPSIEHVPSRQLKGQTYNNYLALLARMNEH